MRIIYIILFTFLVPVYCSAQEASVSVIYNQEIKIPKEEEPSNERDVTLSRRHQFLMNKTKEIANQLEYELKVNGNESSFKMKEFLVKDDQQHLLSLANVYAKGEFYNNTSTAENLWQVEAFGKDYLVKLPQQDWKINKENEIINGYNCQKAETVKISYNKGKPVRQRVIAWYTSEIPLNFGPLGYIGLPGLIVKLEIEDRSFILQEIRSKKNLNVKKPEEGKEVSLMEYYELYSQAMGNF